mmetsp:Transcript_15436/g.27279  ORF Transcript_15436/g.27279 Transcript_15436/m.27279 type:complete len:239 (-) Transcript_15436:692-1408(-)
MPPVVHRRLPARCVRHRIGCGLLRVCSCCSARVWVTARIDRGGVGRGLLVGRVRASASRQYRIKLRPLALLDVAVHEVRHATRAEVDGAADADERDGQTEHHGERGLVVRIVRIAVAVWIGGNRNVCEVRDVHRNHRGHQQVVAVLRIRGNLKRCENHDEDQRQRHERRTIVASGSVENEHKHDAGNGNSEIGEAEAEERVVPAAPVVDRITRHVVKLVVECVGEVDQNDLLKYNHEK